MLILKFIAPSPPYFPGERAGFDQSTADILIARGAAVLDETPEPTPEAEAVAPVDAEPAGVDETPEPNRKKRR